MEKLEIRVELKSSTNMSKRHTRLGEKYVSLCLSDWLSRQQTNSEIKDPDLKSNDSKRIWDAL